MKAKNALLFVKMSGRKEKDRQSACLQQKDVVPQVLEPWTR